MIKKKLTKGLALTLAASMMCSNAVYAAGSDVGTVEAVSVESASDAEDTSSPEYWQNKFQREIWSVSGNSDYFIDFSPIGNEKFDNLISRYADMRVDEVTNEASKNKLIKEFWDEYYKIPKAEEEFKGVIHDAPEDLSDELKAEYEKMREQLHQDFLNAGNGEDAQNILDTAQARCDAYVEQRRQEIEW